jgi:hypothetical protein
MAAWVSERRWALVAQGIRALGLIQGATAQVELAALAKGFKRRLRRAAKEALAHPGV